MNIYQKAHAAWGTTPHAAAFLDMASSNNISVTNYIISKMYTR